MRLVNGNALVAGLAASAFEAGVEIRVNSPARRLLTADGKVTGAVVGSPDGDIEIRAARGVVLACGGFPHDVARKKALLPHAPTGREHWSAASRGNTGDGLRLGEGAGGVVSTDLVQAAALAPVSLVPRADGSVAHFPHLIERAKPGLIAVTAAGRRFTNEADSYYDFMRDLIEATPKGQPVAGLAGLRPRFHPPLRAGRRQARADAAGRHAQQRLSEARRHAGRTGAGLRHRRRRPRKNRAALQRPGRGRARDTDFGKGETAYNRVQGDAATGQPNPCMAPLARGPFYAVKVLPGSLGTFAGLQVNASAQVLDAAGQPIAGLYAGGNDMNSMMGGRYPSGGITLGPAMTFGFIAAHHAAGIDIDSSFQAKSAVCA